MTDTRIHAGEGTLLGGRYRLAERIASGGMATVWRGTDEVLGRTVAVKVMHPGLSADRDFARRFRAEAQHAARLNHPNVVTVHDAGDEGGTLFIVMEIVDGTTLREMLDGFGALDADTVRHVVWGVAAALDHAHAKGVVHRDVKPENVLLTSDGRVKVVDFGVAKALAADAAHLTGPTTLGTVIYVAPEQLTGEDVDARADVYALGVMTYEMLTGSAPFRGDTSAAVAAARLEGSVPSPGISPEVDGAVARATARDPDDRFDTAGELSRALGGPGAPTHLRETTEIDGPRSSPVPTATTVLQKPVRPRRHKGRRRWPWAALTLILAVAGAFAAYTFAPWAAATVPRVAGMSPTAAERTLTELGLEVGGTQETFHDAVPAGAVIRTEPAAGESLRRGTSVDLVVSKGPELFEVPSVTGKGIEEARAALEEAGFAVGEETEVFSGSVPAGAVVEQTLQAGADAREGTAIDLVVSKGPEMVKVPGVAESPDAAQATLEEAGFDVVRTEAFSDAVASGNVIGTDPGPGNMAPKGSKVTLVVSKGPKPFAMPDLTGMTLDAAKAKAQSLGLVVQNTSAVPGSSRPSGEVQGQNPPAGTEVRKGTKIDLWYAA